MTDPIVTGRRLIRYAQGAFSEADDVVVTEHPVTLLLNGEEFATLVCTPEYVEDLAIGFLASEGAIATYGDLKEIGYDAQTGYVYADTHRPTAFAAEMHSKRYVASCCGKSRQGFYFWSDARTAKRIDTREAMLAPEDCIRLMGELQRAAETFRSTGGVHNAALCDRGGIRLMRSDIGRHNALDKLYGHVLRVSDGILPGRIVAFSGRISSEILLKVAKLGGEIVLSKSAPTALALDLAEDLGITAVGFIRGASFNVYTHPERISFPGTR
ncbi:formate dehydrogenase accessory sulfurtransferase FdhD [Cohnella sp. REN36]|uniref:formate dehydrogenase accessory sulfurtransferase FdhD n=1 Tax=Cohnella sp. REN36 TaxID=2887347 RepID=UPI001D145D2C|nr:formate dehydrogenase accessory sulfurtransferase FdhD [Cohnella sp. REN36]MCC3374957.1 formate dehydrogenase accessory sulfurtransferase FdhD [Cohnella sp. REN36]